MDTSSLIDEQMRRDFPFVRLEHVSPWILRDIAFTSPGLSDVYILTSRMQRGT